MKTSIKKLLSSIQFHIVLLVLMVTAIGLTAFSSQAAFDRIDNIRMQEKLARNLLMLDHGDLKLSQIKSDGILKQLPIFIEKVQERYPYEFIDWIFQQNPQRTQKAFALLRKRLETLEKAARIYFGTRQNGLKRRTALQTAVDEYEIALYPLLEIELESLAKYRQVMIAGIGLLLMWTLLLFAAVRRTSRVILADVSALSRQEGGTRTAHKFLTSEMNSIALRLRQSGHDPLVTARQDPLTQLLNYDGFKKTFDQRFTKVKASNIFLCVFEIDNYSKLVNHYPLNIIEPVILKIASIMKLHQQQNDLLSYLGDGRFAALFVRGDKLKAFNDFDHIRQMVEDNRFKLPHATLTITLSGGFASKTSSQSLDDTLKNAMDYLGIARQKGGNSIADIRDNTKVI